MENDGGDDEFDGDDENLSDHLVEDARQQEILGQRIRQTPAARSSFRLFFHAL